MIHSPSSFEPPVTGDTGLALINDREGPFGKIRVTAYHALSIMHTCISARSYRYSFRKQKAIRTGRYQRLIETNQDILLSQFMLLGSNLTLATTLSFLFSPAAFIIAYPVLIVAICRGKTHIADEENMNRRAQEVRNKIAARQGERLLTLDP